jgi:ATP-binding cassette subfamily C (CFTR/MRP) protein 1
MDTVVNFTPDGNIEQLQSPQKIIPEGGPSSHPLQLAEAVDRAESQNDVDTKTVSVVEPEQNETLDTGRQTGDWTVYKHYIRSVGWWRFGLVTATHLLSAALDNFPSRLLRCICPLFTLTR